jgi:hypothetical protein
MVEKTKGRKLHLDILRLILIVACLYLVQYAYLQIILIGSLIYALYELSITLRHMFAHHRLSSVSKGFKTCLICSIALFGACLVLDGYMMFNDRAWASDHRYPVYNYMPNGIVDEGWGEPFKWNAPLPYTLTAIWLNSILVEIVGFIVWCWYMLHHFHNDIIVFQDLVLKELKSCLVIRFGTQC